MSLVLVLITQTTLAWDYSGNIGDTLYKTYLPEDNGAGEISTSLVEDQQGNIYVGNETGLLKFDGEHWSLLPETGNSSYVITAAVDADDNIWMASLKSVGYYSANEQGEHSYHDVTDFTASAFEGKDPGTFWKLYAHQGSIFLITSECVLRWEQDEWRSWEFESERRVLPSWAENSLFIHARGTGVFRLTNDEFELIAEDTSEIASGIISIIGNTEHGLLCATVSNGLFYLQEGGFKRAYPQLPIYQILHAGISQDGHILLSTTHDGVITINQAGQKISLTRHIQSPIYCTMEDSNGTIWVAGIGSILAIPNRPLTYYADSANDIQRHAQDLYYTNGNALKAILHQADSALPKVVDQGTAIWDIQPIGDELLYGDFGTFNSIENHENPIKIQTPRQIGGFFPSWINPNIVYSSDSPKVSRWKKTSTGWQYLDTLKEFNSRALTVVELPNSNLLISTENSPLLLADWEQEDPVSPLGKESGLPEKFIWAHSLRRGDLIIVITNKGLFRYDSHTEQFHHDPVLGNNLGNDAYALEYSPIIDQAGWVLILPTSERGAQQIGKLTFQDGVFTWAPYQLPSVELAGKLQALFQEKNEQSDEILWVGGSRKILRYNISQMPAHEAPPTNLTHISEQNTNQVYYNGAGAPPDSLHLDFPQKSLIIHYAATPSPIKVNNYQTRLTGFNESWSEPHKFTFREFTNLSSGSYTFAARAIDELGRTGKAATLTFTIPPPWYRAWYAYLIYIVFGLFILAGLNRLKNRSLRLRNERLTALVNQRTHELETQKLQLLKANKAKQNFLASMSHEIRNPLNGIIGIARLLKQKEEQQGIQSEETTHLYSCSHHLNQLLSQTLDYSSLEAGKLRTRVESFDPSELLREVIQIQSGMAQEKGIRLELKRPDIKHNWKGDPVLLRQILINLISNGIKYTDQGTVSLILNYTEKEDLASACFEVIDTGPGVPSGHENMIFEEFTRLPESEMSHIPGTGLGLTISAEMARLMGGSLTLDTNHRKGARFLLKLEFEIERFRRKNKSDSERGKSDALKGKRVLIADDMEFNRYISTAVLTSMGAEIDEAENGLIAFNKLNESTYDFALLDLNMPEMSGLEVVEAFLKNHQGDTPEFFALSAYNTPDVEEKCMAAGFNQFIEKPLDPEKLKKKLKHHYNRSTPQSENSLLDYLAQTGPKSLEELQAEYNQSFKEELDALDKALAANNKKEQDEILHKLLGLCRVRKHEVIDQLVEEISAQSKQGASHSELAPLLEQLSAQINTAPNDAK